MEVATTVEPEHPGRRRSRRSPAITESSPTRPSYASLRRAVLAARLGRLAAVASVPAAGHFFVAESERRTRA